MRLRSLLQAVGRIFGLFIIVALLASPRSFAAQQSTDIPAWLKVHVGDVEGQIAQVVLQRARALYQQKLSNGAIKNPCYFAMDATRPNDLSDGNWDAGSTSSANATDHFWRFRRGTAAGGI